MAYELNVHRDSVAPCSFCSIGAVTRTFERIEDAAGVPLWRSVRRITECENCRRWKKLPVDAETRARHPRTPGIGRRIAITWAILGSFILWGGLWTLYRHIQVGRYTDSPQVGDHWTVIRTRWPSPPLYPGTYGVLEVKGVDAHEVQLAACEGSDNQANEIRSRCSEFPLPMPAIERSQIQTLVDSGSVADIHRGLDEPIRIGYFIASLVLVGFLLFVHARRTRRALK